MDNATGQARHKPLRDTTIARSSRERLEQVALVLDKKRTSYTSPVSTSVSCLVRSQTCLAKMKTFYMELSTVGGEGGNGLSVPRTRDDPTSNDHDQAVLKFFKRYSEDLTSRLPIGSMIERMHSLGVITLEERSSLERKRDVEQETDEAMAVGVLSLVDSTDKSAEQRIAFLRVIEERRPDGLTIGILRDIWTLLQSQKTKVPANTDSNNAYQAMVSTPPPMVYQDLIPKGKEDPIGEKRCTHSPLLVLL